MQEMFPFGHSALVGPGSHNRAFHIPPMVMRTPVAKKTPSKKPKEKPATLVELLASPRPAARERVPSPKRGPTV